MDSNGSISLYNVFYKQVYNSKVYTSKAKYINDSSISQKNSFKLKLSSISIKKNWFSIDISHNISLCFAIYF